MLAYPVRLTPDRESGGYVVNFPDIPEALTQGETVEEALQQAQDALETALDFYFDERRAVPMPSRPKRGQRTVALPISIEAKILLLNEMTRQGVRPADLARRLKTSPQAINRLVNLKYATRIDSVAEALEALGKTLEIRAA
ncbi:MAG TPA: type II toxin-antitoxin system HicB family antitoxin [Acidobacteriaceae bacterium]|jgi:antitoxin HicB|nr:type II toxin-antitoxin system HicB family antitoxin [Acidobacteriaceae bacterium]